MHEDPRLCETYLAAMDVLAKPWNGMLMAVLEDGPMRFRELSERVPDIGDRMLTARLKELERRGLVIRRVEPGPPVRVSYALTEVGRGFCKVAEAVKHWGKSIVSAQEHKAPCQPVPDGARRPKTRR